MAPNEVASTSDARTINNTMRHQYRGDDTLRVPMCYMLTRSGVDDECAS